jgi:hypothetical protein
MKDVDELVEEVMDACEKLGVSIDMSEPETPYAVEDVWTRYFTP